MANEVDPSLIQALSDQFDVECQTRHEMGQKKYGPVKFLEVNAAHEAMAEVVDLANYARYLWIKLAILSAYDPSTGSNAPSFATEDQTPVEPDYPTDKPANISFFNPYRRRR